MGNQNGNYAGAEVNFQWIKTHNLFVGHWLAVTHQSFHVQPLQVCASPDFLFKFLCSSPPTEIRVGQSPFPANPVHKVT